MKSISLIALIGSALLSIAAHAESPLDRGFAEPPSQTKPWCYWYWISDNISREGITKDLEAMKRIGIGEALIGNIFLDNQAAGPVKVLSVEWWQLVEHAIREGGRLGVNIGIFNCPGWSQSGGPWIKPGETMRYVDSAEIRVKGPAHITTRIPAPHEQFQDIALLAFPAPQNDLATPTAGIRRISSTPALPDVARIVDADRSSSVTIPQTLASSGTPLVIDIEFTDDITARSLRIFPADTAFGAEAELSVADANGKFTSIRKFKCDRSNPAIGTGFMPGGPVTASIPATTGRTFRLTFSSFFGREKSPSLAEISISPAAVVESYIEKQLAKMHPTPLPLANTYIWKTFPEPDAPDLTVPTEKVRNISQHLSPDGSVTWDAPAGDWIIQRIGKTPTGMKNSPASPEGQGLEVDKMNRKFSQQHFDAFVGQLLKRMPAADRKALTRVVADSYEMGSQNWTDGMADSFRKQFGYDPTPWLPVLSGRIVGSTLASDRFLWDLRRIVADRVATEYVGGLNAASKEHGLGLWLENYGHWGFPGEFLKYGGQSDRIGGEFWVTGDLGSIECRAASSCANTYGKPFVSAESFTGGPAFVNSPKDLKARGDWSFCEGINHVVLHVYIQQPTDDRIPGINAPWGSEFNRHNTWFEKGRAWVDYERRCCWMLQQGWRVADVTYFIGEDAPKMTGAREPSLPPGRDFDFINADVITSSLSVKDGELVLPHGVSYKVLVLPNQDTIRPAVLRKIRDLVKAGATVLGLPPLRSPSLQDQPQADHEVQALANEIWGSGPFNTPGEHHFGTGRVIWGKDLTAIFASTHTPPALEFRGTSTDANLLFTHRRSHEAEIFFISNQKNRDESASCAFRVTGRQPELWNPVTGEQRPITHWSEANGQSLIPIDFAPTQSWFVVFRNPGKPSPSSPNIPVLTPLATLNQPWVVSFDTRWGGPASCTFPSLTDWTTHPDERIRFYSGTASYQTTFDLDSSHGPLILDLGSVRDLATIKLNDKDLGTLWTAPWQVDITSAAKSGPNKLEITITNPWNNRIIGDLKLPQAQRLTSLSLATVKQNAPLQPAGLLGPVKLMTRASEN